MAKPVRQLKVSNGHNASTTRSTASLKTSCRPHDMLLPATRHVAAGHTACFYRPHGILLPALRDVLRFLSTHSTQIMLRCSPRYTNWQHPTAFTALDKWLRRQRISINWTWFRTLSARPWLLKTNNTSEGFCMHDVLALVTTQETWL